MDLPLSRELWSKGTEMIFGKARTPGFGIRRERAAASTGFTGNRPARESPILSRAASVRFAPLMGMLIRMRAEWHPGIKER
jgi:hypothetical protein